jgi:hypothetical protein
LSNSSSGGGPNHIFYKDIATTICSGRKRLALPPAGSRSGHSPQDGTASVARIISDIYKLLSPYLKIGLMCTITRPSRIQELVSVSENTSNDGPLFEIFAAAQLLDISVSQWIRCLKNGFDMTPTLKEPLLR